MTCLDIKVSPKAARNAITGWIDGTLKISVTAAPERGKANAAVVTLIAASLGLPKSAVVVARGQTSKTKRIEIAFADETELRRRIDRLLR